MARPILIRRFLAITGTLLALPLLYLLAAVIGHLLQGPHGTPSESPAHTIYLYGNAFHTDIILPTPLLLAENPQFVSQLALGQTDYIAFGWGSETAYTSLTEITDLSLGRALKSLWFDHAVLHATPIKEGIDPIAAGARPLAISAAGQRRLQKEIIASFAQTSGNLAPLHGITHGNGDKFFRATGRFHPFRTCNVWVGTNLRRAGIKTGIGHLLHGVCQRAPRAWVRPRVRPCLKGPNWL